MGMPNDFTWTEFRRCLQKKPLPIVAFGSTASIAAAMAAASNLEYRVDAILPGTTAKARVGKIDRFQDGQIELLFVHSHLATGMSLSAGNTVLFLDPSTWAEKQQAEGRCHRINKQDAKLAMYARAYGMGEKLLKRRLRRERWGRRWKTIKKWLFGFAICTLTLM